MICRKCICHSSLPKERIIQVTMKTLIDDLNVIVPLLFETEGIVLYKTGFCNHVSSNPSYCMQASCVWRSPIQHVNEI